MSFPCSSSLPSSHIYTQQTNKQTNPCFKLDQILGFVCDSSEQLSYGSQIRCWTMSSQQNNNGKLMPNLDQNSTKLLNLTVLQRIDPFIEEILITAAHVTLYQFSIDNSQWVQFLFWRFFFLLFDTFVLMLLLNLLCRVERMLKDLYLLSRGEIFVSNN